MATTRKNAGTATPVKNTHGSRSKNLKNCKFSENSNPNFSHSSPNAKPSNSPSTKSAKSQKSASRNPIPAAKSVGNKITDRKFVVAKKNQKKENGDSTVTCKCKENGGGNLKCLCVAYDKLRVSQEGFFKKSEDDAELDKGKEQRAEGECEGETQKEGRVRQTDDGCKAMIGEKGDCLEKDGLDCNEAGVLVRKKRETFPEEVRKSVPESGKVMSLVKAFERFVSISKESDARDEKLEASEKPVKWALKGWQHSKDSELHVSSSKFSPPPELLLTSENLGLMPHISDSISCDGSSGSIPGRTSNGGRRSRRNSTESTGTMGGRKLKNKQPKATLLKPFQLRTEQRGRLKEEEFMKQLQEMMIEEERQRIPIAQGLPWTTDEPECLTKPPVKESTMPVNLQLHTGLRALERAEFDHQVAEKMSLIDQYRQERERQRKLEEEEEIRKLRKELVPKAQPMPYFDRPFIPKRSTKNPTKPKEPKFHMFEYKMECCQSLNEMGANCCDH